MDLLIIQVVDSTGIPGSNDSRPNEPGDSSSQNPETVLGKDTFEATKPILDTKSIENILVPDIKSDSVIHAKPIIKPVAPKYTAQHKPSEKKPAKGLLPVNKNDSLKDYRHDNIMQYINLARENTKLLALNPNLKIYATASKVENAHNYFTYLTNPESFRRENKRLKINPLNDWFIGVFILAFIILSWAKLFFNRYFTLIIKSIFNYRLSVSLFNDKSIFLKRINLMMNMVFTINIALFFTQTLQYYSIDPFGLVPFVYFILLLAIVPIIYGVKSVSSNLIGHLFLASERSREYIFNVQLLNKLAGMAFFPVIVLIPYINGLLVPVLIRIGYAIIILMLVLRLIRVVQIFFQKEVSILYLFLYLCTLELFPVFWMIKIFILYT